MHVSLKKHWPQIVRDPVSMRELMWPFNVVLKRELSKDLRIKTISFQDSAFT